MPLYQVCGICFESKCNHWTLHKESITENKTVIEKNHLKNVSIVKPITKEYEYLICKCKKKHAVTDHEFVWHKCSGCPNQICYGRSPLDMSRVKNHVGYCLRSKCHTCKGTGSLLFESFKRCENCDGTGGIRCDTCCGTRLKPGLNFPSPCPSCTNGYSKCCEMCGGARAMINGTAKRQCSECKSPEQLADLDKRIKVASTK